MDIFEDVWANKLLPRYIILKARQEGISTLIQAIFFVKTITQKLITCKTISYEEDSAIALFEMSERFYRNLPPEFQPATQFYTKKSLVFKDKEHPERSLDSKLFIDTAKNLKSGRSETITFLHISEIGFIENAGKLLISLFNAVPKKPNTMIALESTGNGMGNEFHKQWERAVSLEQVKDDPNYEDIASTYIKIFIPWFWHIEYKKNITKSFVPYDFNHPKFGNEVQLMEQYNLGRQQLSWRRHTIISECLGDIDTFKQEYPANDVEAFLASGDTIFDKLALQELLDSVQPPKFTGYIKRIQDHINAEKEYNGNKPELEFIDDRENKLLIWDKPKEGEHYILGVDVSEGIDVGEKDTDNSCIHVYNRINWKLVASWCGKIDPDLLGDLCYDIGWYYNMAWLVIEKNNHGLVTLKKVQNFYPLIYFKIEFDEKTDKKTKKLGWETNKITRPLMIGDLKMLVRDRLARIPDKETIKEMLTFIRYPDGSTKATAGKHDDRVIASALAYQGHKTMPIVDLSPRRKRLVRNFSNR